MKILPPSEYAEMDAKIVAARQMLKDAEELLREALLDGTRNRLPLSVHKDRLSGNRGLISKAILDLERLRNAAAEWQGVTPPGAMN